jgi:hypothetical protein
MNSLLTIELNNFFMEWIKDNPITGKLSLDQKIISISIAFLSTYLAVVLAKMSSTLFGKLFQMVSKDDYILKNYKKKKDIYHIKINYDYDMNSALGYYIPKLPIAKSLLNNNKDSTSLTLKFNRHCSDPKEKFVFSHENIKLPDKTDKNNSDNSNELIFKKFVNFK